MDKIRFGVIGLRFGDQLVRTLVNMHDAELAAVTDRSFKNPQGLDAYAAHYGAMAYGDGCQMMQEAELDAVVIATSPRTRAELMQCAIDNDLAMFIEKPWASDLAHARELAALSAESSKPVMCAFSFRYHPAIVKLQQLVDGELGAGWLLNGHYVFNWQPDPAGWLWDPEIGGGFINENSCHLFDAVCSLLGKPATVSAEATTHLGMPSENCATVNIRFANGALAALTIGGIGASAMKRFPRVELIAKNGQAVLSGQEHIWTELEWAARDEATTHHMLQSPEGLGKTRYTDAFNHFINCIRDNSQPQSGAESGVWTVAIAMAVYESARSGRTVELDL